MRAAFLALFLAPAAAASDLAPDDLLVAGAGSAFIDAFGFDAADQKIEFETAGQAEGIAVGPDGRVYAVSSTRIEVFELDGTKVDDHDVDALLASAGDVAFGPDARLYVADPAADAIVVLDRKGALVQVIAPASADFDEPVSLAFGGDGRLFVVCSGSEKIAVLDGSGNLERVIVPAVAIPNPTSLAIGPDGTLCVISLTSNAVKCFDPATGALLLTIAPTDAGVALVEGLLIAADFGVTAGTFDGHVVELSKAGATLAVHTLPFQFARQLARVPHAFSVKLGGKLAKNGKAPKAVHESATLLYAPGSATAMLALKKGKLAKALGTDAIVFHGAESALGTRFALFQVPFQGVSDLRASIGADFTIDVEPASIAGRIHAVRGRQLADLQFQTTP